MNAIRLQVKNSTFETIHVEESDLIGLRKKFELKLKCIAIEATKEFKFHYFHLILNGDHKIVVNYLINWYINDNEN